MADRFFVVAFRWVTTTAPNLADLEKAMSEVGYDWARLNVHTWFIRSGRTPDQISESLRKQLKGDDSIVVMATQHQEANGWMPKWFWEWFRKPAPAQAALPPPTTPTNALADIWRKIYYVVLDQGVWKVKVDGVHYGPYPTQANAIAAAREAAQKWAAQYPISGAQVRVQGSDNQFRTEWTYGNDPYPPKG